MIYVAIAVVIVLAGTVVNVWWHGLWAEELDLVRAENTTERERLTGWACRLVAREARYGFTPDELSMIENRRSIYDQDEQDLAAEGHPCPPSAAIPWGTDAL